MRSSKMAAIRFGSGSGNANQISTRTYLGPAAGLEVVRRKLRQRLIVRLDVPFQVLWVSALRALLQ
jgi:hypothetical protein